jgi:hypothetical protein
MRASSLGFVHNAEDRRPTYVTTETTVEGVGGTRVGGVGGTRVGGVGTTRTKGTRPSCHGCCACILCLLLLSPVVFVLFLSINYNSYEPPRYVLDNAPVGNCTPSGTFLHCGECGECSNSQDIRVYEEKRQSLTEIARSCAITATFGGRSAGERCFDDTSGLTEGCRDCWMDNVECDQRNCLFVCLWETWTGGNTNNPDGTLSKCFACDEYWCLTDFLACAGASRRRSGIETDIARDQSEICAV